MSIKDAALNRGKKKYYFAFDVQYNFFFWGGGGQTFSPLIISI